jgi:hypothetical protein
MGTVSQPIGRHNPAAEGKLGEVSHKEKKELFTSLQLLQSWLGMEEVGYGLTEIAWNGGSRFWPD